MSRRSLPSGTAHALEALLSASPKLHTHPHPHPFSPTRPSHLNFPPEYTLLCCSDVFFPPFLVLLSSEEKDGTVGGMRQIVQAKTSPK